MNVKDDAGIANPWWMSTTGLGTTLDVQVYRIEDSNLLLSNAVDILEVDGHDGLDPARDLVIPNLSELAYSGGVFYG